MHRRVTFWIGGNRPIPSIAWLGGVTGISPLRVRRDMMSRSRYAVCVSRLRSSKCFGVEPVLGRTFRPEEEQPGRGQVVILSNSVWKRRFGSDPAIVGKEIFVDTRPFQVIGVLA